MGEFEFDLNLISEDGYLMLTLWINYRQQPFDCTNLLTLLTYNECQGFNKIALGAI